LVWSGRTTGWQTGITGMEKAGIFSRQRFRVNEYSLKKAELLQWMSPTLKLPDIYQQS